MKGNGFYMFSVLEEQFERLGGILTHPDTWSCPIWNLHLFGPFEFRTSLGTSILLLMLRPFFPELVMSTDILSFEHPSVLLFCFVLSCRVINLVEWVCVIRLCQISSLSAYYPGRD